METGAGAALEWRASSACMPNDCVEVAIGAGTVYVRSSRDPSRGPLEFDFLEWASFLAGVRNHEFDVVASAEC